QELFGLILHAAEGAVVVVERTELDMVRDRHGDPDAPGVIGMAAERPRPLVEAQEQRLSVALGGGDDPCIVGDFGDGAVTLSEGPHAGGEYTGRRTGRGGPTL